jgi:hypothetical protein
MHLQRLLFILLQLCLTSTIALAQQAFVEGELVYRVSISKPGEAPNKHANNGSLHIYVKGDAVRKELNFDAGFTSTLLFMGNMKPSYTIRQIGNQNLAIQLDDNELKKQASACAQMQMELLKNERPNIANFKTEKVKLCCNNTAPISIYFTRDWTINNKRIFDAFPMFGFLPLSFEITESSTTIIHFELEKIESKPLDNSLFVIPANFRIMSLDEFNAWQH